MTNWYIRREIFIILFFIIIVLITVNNYQIRNDTISQTCPELKACPNYSSISEYTLDPTQKMGHIKQKASLTSQFHQDTEFTRLMGNIPIFGGYFIEFGCADGIENSNTYFFEKAWNWTGLCIEAHPLQIEKAKKARPGSIVLNYGIADQPGSLEFWYLTDQNGKLIDEQLAGFREFYSDVFLNIIDGNIQRGAILHKVQIEVITLTTLLERYFYDGSIIDILSMDCEGCEWHALQGIDFSRWKFIFVTYELNTGSKRYKNQMHEKMTTNGYEFVSNSIPDNPIYKYKFTN